MSHILFLSHSSNRLDWWDLILGWPRLLKQKCQGNLCDFPVSTGDCWRSQQWKLYTHHPGKVDPATQTWGFRWSFAESCTYLLTVNHSKSETTKTPGHFCYFVWLDQKKRCSPFPPPQRKGTFTFLSSPFFGMILFSLLGAAPSCFFCWKKVCFPWKLIPLNKKNTF